MESSQKQLFCKLRYIRAWGLLAEKGLIMGPENKAREKIDGLLRSAGWVIQDYVDLNLGAGRGVAVREFPLRSGEADYLLFVDRLPVGVIEAKPEGTTLSGVAEQSLRYLRDIPISIAGVEQIPPFAFESTGTETFFADLRDPEYRDRRVFAFFTPNTLGEWFSQSKTLRVNLKELPPLIEDGLRDCQIEAINSLERSFALGKPRALIQMASGSGKTFTAVNFTYRLIKFAGAKRILFLVDRNNLGRQTLREFQNFSTPDDGRKFTELYNVQHMTSNALDPVSKVCITTIQRLYSMLKGEEEFDAGLEEPSMFEFEDGQGTPKDVTYNSRIPIETFDFIVTDECHRSIYHLWRQVLEYFDSFIIGLTATPSLQTIGFFEQNLVTEYNHDRAVADGVNVVYDVYRIKTKITEEGSAISAGFIVDKRDRVTRRTWFEELDSDLKYKAEQVDRSVVAVDQIRTVIQTFKDRLFTEIFPGRKEVPKTLIFAKDDSHAEDIVHVVRDVFGKGNEFCKKITYRTMGESPEALIASFRNSYNPRIAVTVDMISTGTDIRPLECLVFMRDVKSRIYFEQMKGRGSRTISSTDLNAVTPDVRNKTHFVIVDAVGVTESDKTDSRPLERKRSIPFDKLLTSVALGKRDTDTLTSLAGRLSRLNKELDEKDLNEIQGLTNGRSLSSLINSFFDALDPDRIDERAKNIFKTDTPSQDQIAQARKDMVTEACSPFDDPKLRNKIIEIQSRNEQIIDTISKDTATFFGYDEKTNERAKEVVTNFKKFIEQNKDKITALQIIYSKPYGRRQLTYEEIKQLAEVIEKPPYSMTPELLWQAFERLEKSKVRKASPQRLLTDMISLIRFAIEEYEILEPFSETVNRRFEDWLTEQEKVGRKFTPEQLEWLTMIKNHIAASLTLGMEDLDYAPFYEKGGPVRAYHLFGQKLSNIIEELNEELVAL